jgi:hypothetical protein
MQKTFLLSTMPDEVNWAIFQEYRIGNHILAYDEQITNFIFGYL